MLKRNTTIFIGLAIVWEITVAILYGVFLRYSPIATFNSMGSHANFYPWALSTTTTSNVSANTTQPPNPYFVVMVAIALLIVGLALIAAYVERSSVTGMAFTLLIFALTVQNYFIYRIFWENLSVNDPNASVMFSNRYYDKINPINFGNSIQIGYPYAVASFIDAVAAALGMYAAYTAVIGRIGFAEIFFLTWLGPFFYELNSQLLWRFVWTDTGYPLRAFAFGGTLGLVSSLILGKTNLTYQCQNYFSRYKMMGLALLGMIFLWCTFPILLLGSTYQSQAGVIVAETGQVNMWLALASSALGVFSACSLYYRKFSVHELVFTSITGGIAYSSMSDINYNMGAATAIGFTVGFICAFAQMGLKRRINNNGIIDSNSAIFHFIMPSFFAAVFCAVGQGIGNTFATYAAIGSTGLSAGTAIYNPVVQTGRSTQQQGAYQILAWLLSVGMGAIAGLIIGVFYKLVNDHDNAVEFFNDATLFSHPRDGDATYADDNPQRRSGLILDFPAADK